MNNTNAIYFNQQKQSTKTMIPEISKKNVPKNDGINITQFEDKILSNEQLTHELKELIENVKKLKKSFVLSKDEYFNLDTLSKKISRQSIESPKKGEFDTIVSKVARNMPVDKAIKYYKKLINRLLQLYKNELLEKPNTKSKIIVLDFEIFADLKPFFLEEKIRTWNKKGVKVLIPSILINKLNFQSQCSQKMNPFIESALKMIECLIKEKIITKEEMCFQVERILKINYKSNSSEHVVLLTCLKYHQLNHNVTLLTTEKDMITKSSSFDFKCENFFEFCSTFKK